jgi:hypothetical protein
MSGLTIVEEPQVRWGVPETVRTTLFLGVRYPLTCVCR